MHMQNLEFTHHGRFNCENHSKTLHDGRNLKKFCTKEFYTKHNLEAKCSMLKTAKGSCCLRIDINSTPHL